MNRLSTPMNREHAKALLEEWGYSLDEHTAEEIRSKIEDNPLFPVPAHEVLDPLTANKGDSE